jgi:hypothetical protein
VVIVVGVTLTMDRFGNGLVEQWIEARAALKWYARRVQCSARPSAFWS